MRYNIIRSVSSFLTEAVRDENLRFSAEITGQSASPPRWKVGRFAICRGTPPTLPVLGLIQSQHKFPPQPDFWGCFSLTDCLTDCLCLCSQTCIGQTDGAL